ncbi:DUF1758 domain-containing protein [Caerostris darwini]|uniref:DUF1758 domain-containing protein n=1 Tax=Caerostris darwini TaxID=1538125 RepID=A0AAV4V5Z6_9ARAC|nr:DUF1758 domain-containing protein [Caerostris darwini]
MTLAERQNIWKEKGFCFLRLHSGHRSRSCLVFLKCIICGKRHVPLMYEALDSKNKDTQKKDEVKVLENEIALANINRIPKVFLQTLKVKLISDNKMIEVRANLDSRSQTSCNKNGLHISTRRDCEPFVTWWCHI